MWVPKPGPVLFCDWESTHDDHRRRVWAIKRGLGIDNSDTFLYLPCTQPLSVVGPSIRDIIRQNGVVLTINDSQMAGSDYGPDMAQNATRYYNMLREYGTANLVIDHVPKSAMGLSADSNSTGPHGSVVKSNRARQSYELTKHQEPGAGQSDLVLWHRKSNEGPLAAPFGIRITWEMSETTGHLDRVLFTTFEVGDHPVHSAAQPLWKRIWDCLEEGLLTVKELAELLPDKSEDVIRSTLNRYKDKFVNVKLDGDRWARRAI